MRRLFTCLNTDPWDFPPGRLGWNRGWVWRIWRTWIWVWQAECEALKPLVVSGDLLLMQQIQGELFCCRHLQIHSTNDFSFTFACFFLSDDSRMTWMSIWDLTDVTTLLQDASTECFIMVFASKQDVEMIYQCNKDGKKNSNERLVWMSFHWCN